MEYRKFFFATIIFFSLSVTSFSQGSYRININLAGLNDSLIVMASYVGDKQFVVDTAYPDKKYNYLFTADSLLPEGMYLIASASKTKLFDFIVSGNQQHSITGDVTKLPGSLRSGNSDQNKLLFDYIGFLSEKQKQMSKYMGLRSKYSNHPDSLAVVENQVKLLNEEVDRHIKGLINNNRGGFFSTFLNMMQEPELPETPILANGRPDSVFAYRQYKAHFWDNIDLSDSSVIRTPVIHGKVEQYLNNLTAPVPDSLKKSIDTLFARAKENPETFKYLAWFLTIEYESSEIMGYDAVFVHLVDKYYDDPKMSWMNPTVKQNLIKRAEILRPILLGKEAPEMILLDTLQNPVSLKNIPADFTIIYFWDPDCSHCKKETPILKDFYANNKLNYNLEVYAVCMDTSWKDMKEYIRQNDTKWINVNGFYSMTPDFRELYDVRTSPVMYLLDREKKIIAKRVLTEQMREIIQELTEKF
jgi:thiol-disulfide isomerase/thioredoxin